MPTPQQEVLAWLHTQKDWLQEAASKILTQNEISDTDIDNLIVLLKSTAGQAVTATRTFPSLSTTATPTTLRLDTISEVKGIESLAPRNPLVFGTDNLTVIYGNNGSGKSGYTRILKKATGKANARELKPNVYISPAPTDRSCKINYTLEGTATEIVWNTTNIAINDLLGVDIFDADNATIYLTKEKEASYTPPLVALFEDLVSVCKKVSAKLETEKSLLVKRLPTLPAQYEHTVKARLYNGLNYSHTEILLASILVFTDTDKQSIIDVEERIKTEDPNDRAVKLRKFKAQLDGLITNIKTAYSKINEESCIEIFTLKSIALSKRQIAIDANSSQGDLFKLEGVGSETWKALWEAARKYSTEEAYRGEAFPQIEDAKCVLCHQDLDNDALKRMQGFDDYVKSILESDAITAEKVFQDKINSLPPRPNIDIIKNLVELSDLTPEEWEVKLDAIWTELEAKINELKTVDGSAEIVGLVSSSEITALEAISESYEALAKQYNEDALGFDRVAATNQLLELKVLEWTAQQRESILAEVVRLKSYKALDNLIHLTVTRGISNKSSELSESIITTEYVRRFNKELIALGANRIKVELVKTRIQNGVVKHQIKLKGSVSNTSLVDVLSEGEQRIVSLAAFLADVIGRTESTPFIFDDPISSLDQDFEEKTIDRLISLSADRQVIVFTHRLSFLGIISDKATSILKVNIRQEPWGSGEVGEIPLFGKKPEKALKHLKESRLITAKNLYEQHGSEVYYPLAKAICSDFRILLERIVELYFLADVVQRHRRAVNTMGKIGNLVKIIQADCDVIDAFMGKYSVYEHSQSAQMPTTMPEPAELEADIDAILTWYEEFEGRS
jgi:ABC-type cobalamin/Fe3+-siderophores transport system ATPase subunit